MLKYKYLLVLFFFLGCSEYATIGLKEHYFGLQPRKIIWFQIAGLSVEHLAMQKFDRSELLKQSNFEQAICYGNMWNYSLFNLRQSDFLDFQSQITGKASLRSTCDDNQHKPIWSYLNSSIGYKNIYFEHFASENDSLYQGLSCSEPNLKKYNELYYFRMGRKLNNISKKNQSFFGEFHSNSMEKLVAGKVLSDKSCKENYCHSKLKDNVLSIYEKVFKNQNKFSFVIRDFQFLNYLKRKDIKSAKSLLNEVNELIDYFRSSLDSRETLIIVSSSGVMPIEFPEAGKKWSEYEKQGKNILYKRRGVHSIVFSFGARAENFCGFYREHEILERIFHNNRKFKIKLF